MHALNALIHVKFSRQVIANKEPALTKDDARRFLRLHLEGLPEVSASAAGCACVFVLCRCVHSGCFGCILAPVITGAGAHPPTPSLAMFYRRTQCPATQCEPLGPWCVHTITCCHACILSASQGSDSRTEKLLALTVLPLDAIQEKLTEGIQSIYPGNDVRWGASGLLVYVCGGLSELAQA